MENRKMSENTITYLVVYSWKLNDTLSFYRELGINFREEQHGGPVHYSCKLGDMVLEFYPAQQRGLTSNNRIGIKVSNLEKIIKSIKVPFERIGRTIILFDPDGRKVVLE